MQGLNWLAITIMTVASFAFGAIWHGPLFGKIWMRIHHGDKKMSDEDMKKSMEGLWKIMIAEFIATFFMIIGLACIIRAIPTFPPMLAAAMIWLAFVLPTMTSTVIWGNDPKKVMCTKITLSSICRFISLVATAFVLSM